MADADQNDAIFTNLQQNQYPIGFDKARSELFAVRPAAIKQRTAFSITVLAATPEVHVSGSKYHAL